MTKSGTAIYSFGAGAVRDGGHKLGVSIGADQATMLAALRMAMERYGECIAVNGSDTFKEQILAAAVGARLPVKFDDPILERHRLLLVEPPTASDAGDTVVRRWSERTGHGEHQWTVAARANAPRPAGEFAGDAYRQKQKIDLALGSTATEPAAPSPAVTTAAIAGKVTGAAAIYIAEREQKRAGGFDIPKHVPYAAHNAGKVAFAGLRSIEGQMLALLEHRDQVMVLEVDDVTADRLKRLSLGAQVRVTFQGAITTKGRRR